MTLAGKRAPAGWKDVRVDATREIMQASVSGLGVQRPPCSPCGSHWVQPRLDRRALGVAAALLITSSAGLGASASCTHDSKPLRTNPNTG